jgi:hypothetical protein
MPEISRFFGIIIRMYFGDHNPPHFHAVYQDDAAEYDINTLSVIKGKLPARAHAMVLDGHHCTGMNCSKIGRWHQKCKR